MIREEEFMALQQLIRSRYQMVLQLVQTKQHFLQTLCYKVNTVSKELNATSTSVFSATIIDLMTEELSLDDIAKMPLEEFAELLQKKGRGRFRNPSSREPSIKEIHQRV